MADQPNFLHDDKVVVIVGSRSAVSLANELVRSAASSAVLEAGKHYTPDDFFENDVEWAMLNSIRMTSASRKPRKVTTLRILSGTCRPGSSRARAWPTVHWSGVNPALPGTRLPHLDDLRRHRQANA